MSIHKRRGRVLIEFIEDTFDELDGSPKRRKGEQVWVDPVSAKSFVDTKGVAKLVEDDEPAQVAAVVEDQGAVVHVAADGTETPSVPDADGMHTPEPETAEVATVVDEKPAEPKRSGKAKNVAPEPSGTDETVPGTDVPTSVVGGS